MRISENLETALIILITIGLNLTILIIIFHYVMPLLAPSYVSASLNQNAESIIPEVKELAISLTEKCGSDICKMENIGEYLYYNIKRNLEYAGGILSKWTTLEDALENGGDCKTFSVIFTAMARSLNMTAKVVSTEGHSLVLARIGNNNYLIGVQRLILQETIIEEYLI